MRLAVFRVAFSFWFRRFHRSDFKHFGLPDFDADDAAVYFDELSRQRFRLQTPLESLASFSPGFCLHAALPVTSGFFDDSRLFKPAVCRSNAVCVKRRNETKVNFVSVRDAVFNKPVRQLHGNVPRYVWLPSQLFNRDAVQMRAYFLRVCLFSLWRVRLVHI